MMANEWWEIVLNICSSQKNFNPFSGSSTWSKMGQDAVLSYKSHSGDMEINFSDTTKERGHPWRSCLNEGQIPHILFWPLLF